MSLIIWIFLDSLKDLMIFYSLDRKIVRLKLKQIQAEVILEGGTFQKNITTFHCKVGLK